MKPNISFALGWIFGCLAITLYEMIDKFWITLAIAIVLYGVGTYVTRDKEATP